MSRDIDIVSEGVTPCLGYGKYSNLHNVFAQGIMYFAFLPTGFGKTLCYTCLPSILIRLLYRNHSYVYSKLI